MILKFCNSNQFNSSLYSNIDNIIRSIDKKYQNYLTEILFLKALLKLIKINYDDISKIEIYYFAHIDLENNIFGTINLTTLKNKSNENRIPFYLYDIIIKNKRFIVITEVIKVRLLTLELFLKLNIFKNKPRKIISPNESLESYIDELIYLNNLDSSKELFEKLISFDNNEIKNIF